MSDPVTAFIAVVVKIGAAIAAAYKAYVVVRAVIIIAAIIAVSLLTKALTSKPGATLNQGQELSLKLDATMPRQVAVGRTATGGSQVWAYTYSNDSNVPNKYLVRIIALSDRPIDSVVEILEGTNTLTFTGDIYSGMTPCNQHLLATGAAGMSLQIFKGSDAATSSSFLQSTSGGLWTAEHKGQGIAYAVVQYTYEPAAFPNGEPQLVFVVDGAHCYDDRLGLDVEGTQNLEDPTTWAFSRNAAVITHQTLRGFRTLGSLIVGSQADARDINPDVAMAAANTCDEAVDLDAGGTEPRYNAAMMLTSANAVQTDLNDLKLAMDGEIYDRGGSITVMPGGTRTPIMDLTDDDIVWAEERSFQAIASLQSLYNVVQGQYVPSSQHYTAESYPIQKDTGYIAQDGGDRIVLNRDYKAVNSDTQIQRITKRLLAASRFQGTIGFVGPLYLCELEQGDWFTLTSARWGFTSKVFRVVSPTVTTDLHVAIIALETSTSIDGWSTADEVPRTTTTKVNPGYSLPVPTLTVTPLAQVDGGAEIPMIEYALSIPIGSAATGYILQIRKVGGGTINTLPTIPLDSSTGIVAASLNPSTDYELRARTTDGRFSSAWSSWSDVTTTDTLGATKLGDHTAEEILDALEAAQADADAAIALAQSVISEADIAAEAALQTAIGLFNNKKYTDQLNYVNGVPVGTLVVNETDRATGVEGEFAHTLSLVGAKSLDGLAFEMNQATFKISSTESMASRLNLISSQFGGTSGSYLLTTLNSTTSLASTSAANISLLGARNGAGTAFILNSSTVYVNNTGQTLAQYIGTLSVDNGEAAAIANTQITVQLGPGGTIASSIDTVQTSADGAQADATLALSSLNGNEASIIMMTQVAGKITGLRIGGSDGTFDMVGSAFRWVDDSGANPVVAAAYSSGVWRLSSSLEVQAIKALTIVAGHIQTDAINTGHIQDDTIIAGHVISNEITNTTRTYNNTGTTIGGSAVAIGTHTVTLSGAPIDIEVWLNTVDSSGGSIGVTYYMTASGYTSDTWGHYVFDGAAGSYNSTTFVDRWTPGGAGSYTFTVYATRSGGGSSLSSNACKIKITDNRTEA